ncbi:MAG: glycoside hydrolase family 13 protein [Trueperaceae bacterium]|nr:glycoside hydrolase family 13 protein [Trueperaceae bacterium]
MTTPMTTPMTTTPIVRTPEWVKNAVFYQIFPDRFARSPRTRHPRGIDFKPWGSPPEEQGFQGGDLHGIVDKLDYLHDLGVNALYLNPVFASASNHRYHPYDYYQVDPLLGGDKALRELVDLAHAHGMHVMLDGVFNHASRGFWPFHHILENGGDSPYIDWFTIYDWPLRPYSDTPEQPANYEMWAGLPMLPKLNTKNPGVRDMIYDVGRYWLEHGVDGWRLDVPNEIDDDEFWRGFRRVVKGVRHEAYICGEIWDEATRWLQGDQFDAVMNYLFTWGTLSFFGADTLRPDYDREHLRLEPLDAGQFKDHIDHMHSLYHWEITQAQLNLLSSHDMARALWIVGNDVSALTLSVLFQMTMPGAPCIYYGDEIGMSSGDDPYCREAFPWNHEEHWDQDLRDFYRRAIALRHRFPALRTGSFEAVYGEDSVYAFVREDQGDRFVVVFNVGNDKLSVSLPLPADAGGRVFETVWPEARQDVSVEAQNGSLTLHLAPRQGYVLRQR